MYMRLLRLKTGHFRLSSSHGMTPFVSGSCWILADIWKSSERTRARNKMGPSNAHLLKRPGPKSHRLLSAHEILDYLLLELTEKLTWNA